VTIEFHPVVQRDFAEALDHYEARAGLHVADRFEEEFRTCITAIKAGPTRFPFYRNSPVFRRARLKSFPFLIIYRVKSGIIRVTLLKHERRHPLYGMHRW
jgi:plasmid stabilization system protein ParE